MDAKTEVSRVAAAIPFGSENAVTRDALVAALGHSERTIRRLIEEARGAGVLIINKQDGRGYYQTIDLDEIENQYRQDTRRAMSILERRKTARRILKAHGREMD
jgi:MarR-like DNA-binding transcriptional regulator SgrR of sgrS sRNA